MLIDFQYLFRRYDIHTDGVLHLGANDGQEADAYTKQAIEKVIWVEALPGPYSRLVDRVSAYPGHVPLLACVSDEDFKEVDFHIANNGEQSSSMLEFGTHSQAHPTVKWSSHCKLHTIRVDTLLKKFNQRVGPDWFLNIDIQGAELLALRGMGELIRQFRYAYIEVNRQELYKGCPMVEEIDAFLAAYSLRPVETKWTGAGWGDRFYIKEH